MVFSATTNHYATLFWRHRPAWMDEVALYWQQRVFSRKRVVTISTSRSIFQTTYPLEILIELIGPCGVVHVGRTSLKVEVSIFSRTTRSSDKRTRL